MQMKDNRHSWMRLSGTQSKLYGLLSSTTQSIPYSSSRHHFPQTRLAGSCAAVLQAHTVFRK